MFYDIHGQMVRNKDTAGKAHKRGGSMIFTDKQLSKIYLDVCEQFTGKKRDTIRKEFERNELNTSSIEDLEIYLRNRVVEIPPKIIEREVENIIEKPQVTNGQALMAEIMKKIADKPAPTIQPTTLPK
jgi:hypothetical protein